MIVLLDRLVDANRILLVTLILTACGTDGGGGDDAAPLEIAYRVTAAPGEEVWKCNVTDLPIDRYVNVNRVESEQTDAVHHMDLMAVALAAPDLQPGSYDCADVYAQYPRLMDDGILIYAAQQAQQAIQLPEGVSAELLPRLRVMHEIHFVNPSDAPVEAYSKILAYPYDDTKVTTTIWGGAVRDVDIAVPPGATDHVEWTRCTMNADVDVLFLSSHTHQLADRTEIRLFDGTSVGEVLYANTDWHAPPLQDHTAAPLHVAKGTGFEFACHYANRGAETVHWGFNAKDEMCQIALVYTPGETSRKCEIVESGVR
ncbi:MAG: hypothetical protein KF773_25830 [Deltaproteobacteria bacterium]|nr:hypothetical protein [Deltaproteobacteria bacterium]MCW5803537.1 hypothetical protein [Deltaproteobacteria bacterium]